MPDDSIASTHSTARSKSAIASRAWVDQQKI